MHRQAFVTLVPSFVAMIFLVCVSVPSPTWSKASLFTSVGPNNVRYSLYLNDWGTRCFHSRDGVNKHACALILYPVATGFAFVTVIFSILGFGSKIFTFLSTVSYCLASLIVIIAFVLHNSLLNNSEGLPDDWKISIESITGFGLALFAMLILVFGFGASYAIIRILPGRMSRESRESLPLQNMLPRGGTTALLSSNHDDFELERFGS